MWRKTTAQSLVEMAMVMPFLIFLCFAIIDMGWYVFGYATLYNSARKGAEEASQLPPVNSNLNNPNDPCAGAVFKAVRSNAAMFASDLSLGNNVVISYPPRGAGLRALGETIEVQINNFQLVPLTPLLTLGRAFGMGSINDGGDAVLTISTTSRRTIESLGTNPNFGNGMACQP